jgi:hypothetical protein
MKKRLFTVSLLLIFLLAGAGLSASGKKEAGEEPRPVNAEWILCVTEIDTSGLPLYRQMMGEAAARSLAAAVSKQRLRFRGEEESGYYRDYAWAKSRANAAKALQAKREERDTLVYRGDPAWKYRKNLRTADEAILKLEGDLAKIDASAPAVEMTPALRLSDSNSRGVYPRPPEPGSEYRFCGDQKADAFLAGSLSEYYGRIYLSVKMYTVHTLSYSFEEYILFSSADMNEAMDEISVRLAAAAAGTEPSAVTVHAAPPDAMTLIDGVYAGTGGIHYRSPGEAEIAVRADNHYPASFSLRLNAGELAELFINLSPLSLAAFEAGVPGGPGSRVYLGSLYMGETPLTLNVPETGFSYISVETPEGGVASMVYRDNSLVKGGAQFVRREENGSLIGSAVFNPAAPVNPEEKRVERARRDFYTAYGVFWFILPASLITAGIAQTYIYANNYVMAYGLYDNEKRRNIYDNAVTGQYVQGAAYGIMGAALGVTFFQIFRYLYASGGDATPIVKSAPPRTEQ